MAQQYRIDVQAGNYSWQVRDDDPAGYGITDDLTIRHSLPDSDLAPLEQPNPSEASFGIVTASKADLDTLTLGDAVYVRYWRTRTPVVGTDTPAAEFYGRVADLSLAPHDLGVLWSVSAVDYTADLAEDETLTADILASSDGLGRVQTLWGQARPEDTPPTFLANTPAITGGMSAKAANPTDLRSAVIATLATWPAQFSQDENGATVPTWVGRAKLVQRLDDGGLGQLHPSQPFVLEPIYREGRDYLPPLELKPISVPDPMAGKWRATADPVNDTESRVILDGARVRFPATYNQRKARNVNRVRVKSSVAGVSYRISETGQRPKITVRLDSDLSIQSDVTKLADMYLPPVVPSTLLRWVADTFEWQIWAEPDASWWLPKLGRLVTVGNLPPAQNPIDKHWFAGLLQSVTFKVSKGRAVALLSLSPPVVNYLTGSTHLLTATSPILTGLDPSLIDPTDTADDWRLVRSS